MKEKKGFELSLNMIITVILALVFLGVAIKVIYGWMPKEIEIPTKCDIYPPTADSPACITKEMTISRGQTARIEPAFYNNEDNDIPASATPAITCGASVDGAALTTSTSGIGQALAVGSSGDYVVLLKVPKDAVRGSYPCTIKLSNTQTSFVINVQ